MQEKEQNNTESKKTSKLTRYSAYLYLALALTIVGVATASIFALNNSVSDLPEYSTPEFSMGDSTLETSSADVYIPILPDDDTPVFGEESGVMENESSEEEVIEEKPLYVCPVENAKILKSCALDKLVFSATMNDYRVHSGLDLAAPLGTEVLCYTSGVVENIVNDDFLGLTVYVKHDYGLVTVYSNLAPALAADIAVGNELETGTVIGYIGETAISESADEPHLHFEMILNGARIDPERELYE